MCQIAYDEGTRYASATAHQSEVWPDVTPDRIRQATAQLTERLKQARIGLTVYPCAEIMASPDMAALWSAGRLMSVADKGQYVMIEMPHGIYVDLRPTVQQLSDLGLRVILAHPERHDEFIDDPAPLEEMVLDGCLVQVSSRSITEPKTGAEQRVIKQWFQRRLVHLLGSDGHSPRRRSPLLAAAYETVVDWIGEVAAEKIGSKNGIAILQGKPLSLATPIPPEPPRRSWFGWFS